MSNIINVKRNGFVNTSYAKVSKNTEGKLNKYLIKYDKFIMQKVKKNK